MLGWRYERAFEASQRYKEGKVIVELAHLIKDNGWDAEWLVPARLSSPSIIQQVSRKNKELPVPITMPSPPHPRFPWSSASCLPNYESIRSESSTSVMKSTVLTPNSVDTQSSPLITGFDSSFGSSHACPQYDSLGRNTLSPGASSCGSSCCGRTPEQEIWPSGLRVSRSDYTDPVPSTAAQGARTEINAPSLFGTMTRSASSEAKFRTLPMGGSLILILFANVWSPAEFDQLK
ncbi:unnamed protein product [Echinostoma caproni]|uniref:Yippee domain-containing protein n=1 Tax=Echinostoma caproni TaxID=27848 RepID=A0A183AVU4_9TREM|nr:unnamed protein product [Echinostoma caproni]